MNWIVSLLFRAAHCFAVSALLAAAPASADEGGLRAMCFAPGELAARRGEEHPVKRQRGFDKPLAERGLAPFQPVAAGQRGAIRRVKLHEGSGKLIALTFDLCEQPGEIAGYDGAIIDYLRANGIKATLFTGGKWMRSHAERMQQLMADPLFEIGSHGEAHRNLRLLSGAALQDEIAGPQRSYETAREHLGAQQCVAQNAAEFGHVPQRISTFRFPYGACNAQSLAAVNDAGLLAIQWDLSTGDPSLGQSAGAIARAALQAQPGSIVIMHANGRGYHTAQALPLFVPKLKDLGFRFVTVTELLAAGDPVIAPTCYNAKPGDTDRYDRPLLAQRRATAKPAPRQSLPAPSP